MNHSLARLALLLLVLRCGEAFAQLPPGPAAPAGAGGFRPEIWRAGFRTASWTSVNLGKPTPPAR
jgi:hypothetical protein